MVAILDRLSSEPNAPRQSILNMDCFLNFGIPRSRMPYKEKLDTIVFVRYEYSDLTKNGELDES